jgi:hypothetical protein
MAEGEKSLDQLVQLYIITGTYVLYIIYIITRTLLTERKIRDMTSLLLPPNWGLHLEFATMVDRRDISAENA